MGLVWGGQGLDKGKMRGGDGGSSLLGRSLPSSVDTLSQSVCKSLFRGRGGREWKRRG